MDNVFTNPSSNSNKKLLRISLYLSDRVTIVYGSSAESCWRARARAYALARKDINWIWMLKSCN